MKSFEKKEIPNEKIHHLYIFKNVKYSKLLGILYQLELKITMS